MSEVIKASESPFATNTFISTGLPQLDRICGGGIPFRRVTVISGPPAQGKSTIALMTLAQAQGLGHKTIYLDSEYAADILYMQKTGIDITSLDIIQPDHGEEGLDLLESYLSKNKGAVAVIDSIGGLLPRQEQEKANGDRTIGAQASMVARFMRKIVPILALNNSALICITHEYTNILSGKVEASGGAKMAYHTSLHFRLKPKFGVVLKSGDRHVGKVVVAEIKKTKMGPTEKQECDLQFLYESGFNAQSDLLADALAKGLISQEGRSYAFAGEKIASGMPKLREWVAENAELLQEALKGM